MVAFTPNRAYPYSTPTDPADIPEAIQALAESIDLDVQDLTDSLTRRPFCKVRSNTSVRQTFPADQITELEFDFVEFDPAGVSNLSVDPTRLTPTSAGFWFVWTAIEVPLAPNDLDDFFLRMNGGELTRYGQTTSAPAVTAGQMMTMGAMAFMDGVNDYFTATFEPVAAFEDYKIRNKQMACFRLTDS